ncbi:hypothetical protein RFI_09097 [Reticulomyxa filosa]|uniref:Mitochondrial import inner membrane translocase subunit TIM50 n=1 Tax=Reticulomyxa filosa TaxID=46433 RepID=X6NP34_RETFI|nr:hypothetical protein RFI_09097 [Reticulomyxa filosa]|eukprot:ETO28035.1 hypothetical protein RFI_09097 [Reticulomyxa filosa]
MITRATMQGWEVVLFGMEDKTEWTDSPDLIKLDEMGGMVSRYFWKNDCCFFNGHYCKDLHLLRRSLGQVLVIDSDPKNMQLFPENAIVIPQWDPLQSQDQELFKLFTLLDFFNTRQTVDVRTVLHCLRGKDIASTSISELGQSLQLAQKKKKWRFIERKNYLILLLLFFFLCPLTIQTSTTEKIKYKLAKKKNSFLLWKQLKFAKV